MRCGVWTTWLQAGANEKSHQVYYSIVTDCTEISSEDFEDFCFGVFESTSLVDIISFF